MNSGKGLRDEGQPVERGASIGLSHTMRCLRAGDGSRAVDGWALGVASIAANGPLAAITSALFTSLGPDDLWRARLGPILPRCRREGPSRPLLPTPALRRVLEGLRRAVIGLSRGSDTV